LKGFILSRTIVSLLDFNNTGVCRPTVRGPARWPPGLCRAVVQKLKYLKSYERLTLPYWRGGWLREQAPSTEATAQAQCTSPTNHKVSKTS